MILIDNCLVPNDWWSVQCALADDCTRFAFVSHVLCILHSNRPSVWKCNTRQGYFPSVVVHQLQINNAEENLECRRVLIARHSVLNVSWINLHAFNVKINGGTTDQLATRHLQLWVNGNRVRWWTLQCMYCDNSSIPELSSLFTFSWR